MPPQLALLLTTAFVVFLFRRESRQESSTSRALWIPLLWVLITGSRFVSQWLEIWGLQLGDSSLEEGSPIDALAFIALIVAGFVVLKRRQVSVATIARNNGWLTLFFIYCFVAIIWSDFPFVAFKRWIKILGHPIMALIILTEPDPLEAVTRLMKRAAYVLLPFSVLFIKYYPEYGRGFDAWTGAAVNTGITPNKNQLGCVCMILGIFFFWNLLQARKIEQRKARRDELFLSGGFLIMIWWLLSMAHSSTSLGCLLIGMLTVVLLGRRLVSKRYIGTYVLAGILTCVAAETLFGLYAKGIELLGRDPTLTDRTEVWHDALSLVSDPILGAGFESFWLGDRLDKLWEKWWWQPTQAHNGYIETYLNLGLVGVFILAGLIIATFRKIRLELLRNFELGRFRLSFLFAILVYNYTEATFKSVSIVWTVFHIIAMDYPKAMSNQAVKPAETDHRKHETDFVTA